MRVVALAGLASVLAWAGPAARSAPPDAAAREWPAYGGTAAGTRYSSLDQINTTNVGQLEVSWTYDTGEAGGMQTQPIMVGRTLYGVSPQHKTFAVDAATGRLLWTFAPPMEGRGPNRGVTYWPTDRSSRGADRPRVFAAAGQYLYALDAETGKPIEAFGEAGRIDLRRDLGRDPQKQWVRLTTPGIVYRDLLIIGGRVSESAGASPGDVRAYDARSGKLRWTFHTIPRSGAPGADTWPKDAWMYTGGANNWAGMALDEARGLVFVPTGSAAADFYGADRAGDNLYANSLIALRASTGERVWHYQAVHHDIWDRDFPSPPTLVTIQRDGHAVEAVAQTTKHGFVFLFQRTDGQLLFPVVERAFPPSGVEGEMPSRTQPIPLKPAPFSRQQLTADMLTTRTPAAHKAAAEAFAKFRSGGAFVPLSVGVDTIVFPGFDGGAEWGGAAFDPRSGLLFVNANEMAWTGSLAPADTTQSGRGIYRRQCAGCHRDDLGGAPPQIPSLSGLREGWTGARLTAFVREGSGRMPGFPELTDASMAALVAYLTSGEDKEVVGAAPVAARYRFTGYKKFLDPDGYPAIAPPWGTLTAINLNTGDFAWQVPLGEYPELAEAGVKGTGSENYGGPIVTAGGLVFIAATSYDRKFRAFDKATGALLWETTLPFAGHGTPATFDVDGRQYIVVAAGGGKAAGRPSGGVYVAFALPEKRR